MARLRLPGRWSQAAARASLRRMSSKLAAAIGVRMAPAARRLAVPTAWLRARPLAVFALGLATGCGAALLAGQVLHPRATASTPVAGMEIADLPVAVAIFRPQVPEALAPVASPAVPGFPSGPRLAAAAPGELAIPRPLARPAELVRPVPAATPRPTVPTRTAATRRPPPPEASTDRLVRRVVGPPARVITRAARDFRRATRPPPHAGRRRD